MNRVAIVSIAVAVMVLVAGLAMMQSNSGVTVVHASVTRAYSLVPGYAIVFHRYGLTSNGLACAISANNISLPGNFTVCVRLHTDYGYSRVQPVIDHGDWRIEAVPPTNYRFSLNVSVGNTTSVVSVDVPGEMHKPHMYCFGVATFSNGTGVIEVYIDGNSYKNVSFSGSRIVQTQPIVFGGYISGAAGGWNATLTLLLVYNRVLGVSTEVISTTSGTISEEHEEYSDIASGVIPYNGLVLYFDPTVRDYYKNVWVDLSGNGNDMMVACSNPSMFTDNTTFFVVWRRYNDNYWHFQYFPWYSRIEIYDLSMNLFGRYVVQGSDNGYGQVIDYKVPTQYVGTFVIYYYDPNEGVTTTVTATTTSTITTTTAIYITNVVTIAETSTVTRTATVTETSPVTSTTTVTSAYIIARYSTVTTTVTVPAAVFRWEWLVLAAMIVVLGIAIYYIRKARLH
jgi:hypothetical protein